MKFNEWASQPVQQTERASFLRSLLSKLDSSPTAGIASLLQKFPDPDTEWRYESRVKWHQTAAHIFDLLYTSDGPASVNIELKK